MTNPRVNLIDDHDPKKHYGVVTATVLNPVDPLLLGRIQVQLSFIDCLDLSSWARVVVPMAGLGHGNYFIPNIGDQVLVAFENGDINAPYIVGSLWNAISFPPLPTPLPQTRALRTLMGNQIVFSEILPTVTIQNGPTPPEVVPLPASPVGPYQTIELSPFGIEMTGGSIKLTAGLNSISITPFGITLEAGPTVKIDMNPLGIEIKAPNITVSGQADVSISGPLVRIN